jgi:hypothetical protein
MDSHCLLTSNNMALIALFRHQRQKQCIMIATLPELLIREKNYWPIVLLSANNSNRTWQLNHFF